MSASDAEEVKRPGRISSPPDLLPGRSSGRRRSPEHILSFKRSRSRARRDPSVEVPVFRPTYIKVQSKFVEPDTLDAYHLPWEWDQRSSGYIIIKQWVNNEFQEELFEHTRKLQQRRGDNPTSKRTFVKTILSPEQVPEDSEGKPAAIKVNLTTAPNDGGMHPASRNPKATKLEDRYGCESITTLKVVDVRRYVDVEGCESAELRFEKDFDADEKGQFRWTHMQWQARSLSEFELFASEIDGVDRHERLLIAKLMDVVQKDEQLTGPRRTLGPTVLRCDGQSSGTQEKPDKWVIFLCFPYLSLGPRSHHSSTDANQYHCTRSLLQERYPTTTIHHLDKNEIIRQCRRLRPAEGLQVPYLWLLVTCSGVILSASPDVLEDTIGQSIKLLPFQPDTGESEKSNDDQSFIRITDPLRRVFFCPRTECRTWFSLMDRVLAICYQDFGNRPEEYLIVRPDGTKMKAQDWQTCCNEENGGVIDIEVRLLTIRIPPRSIGHHYGDSSESTDIEDECSASSKSSKNSRRTSAESGTEVESFDDSESDTGFHTSSKGNRNDQQKNNDSLQEDTTEKSTMETKKREKRRWKSRRSRKRATGHLYEEVGVSQNNDVLISQSNDRRLPPIRPMLPFEFGYAPLHDPLEAPLRPRPLDFHPDLVAPVPPPYRLSKFLISTPSDVVVNKSPLTGLEKLYQDLCYTPKLQHAKKTRTSIIMKTPPDGSTAYGLSKGSQEPSFSSGQDQPKVKVEKPVTIHVPHAFLWHMTSTQANSEAISGDLGSPAQPLRSQPISDKGESSTAPISSENPSAREQDESGSLDGIQIILDSVHRELSRDKEFNAHLILGLDSRQDKLYKSIQPESLDTFTTHMETLLAISDEKKAVSDKAECVAWQVQLAEVGSNLRDLFDFFIPIENKSITSQKYWGAAAIEKMFDHFYLVMQRPPLSEESSPLGFCVINTSQIPDCRLTAPPLQPKRNISFCSSCRAGNLFPTLQEAQAHLRQKHFVKQTASELDVNYYITTLETLRDYRLALDAMRMVAQISEHCIQIRTFIDEIRAGVVDSNGFDESTYHLPANLVLAFERILVLVSYAGYACDVIQKAHQEASDGAPPTFIDYAHCNYIRFLGLGAEGLLESATNDLILMSVARNRSQSRLCERVGLEYVVSLLLGDLAARTNEAGHLDLIKTYKGYGSYLEYEVRNRPRRRLLSKINSFLQELRAVKWIMQQQINLVDTFQALLDPSGFYVSSRTRQNLNRLESRSLQRTASTLAAQGEKYGREIGAARELADVVEPQLRLEQDGNSRAVLVIAIIIVIFQPLSFVAGLLGMNTADIRTQQSVQWIFWAIAIPLTTAVVALSVLISYQLDDLREYWTGRALTPELEHFIPQSKAKTEKVWDGQN